MSKVPMFPLAIILVILISIGVLPYNSFAVDCNHPPSGFGGSWARAYKQWCESCCGTFSSRGPSCNPGSNWGCGQQGGSGSGGSSYDYEAERQRQEAERQRQLEAERQRQQELEEQRKREEEEARHRQEEFERNKQEALKSMKGIAEGELGLKGTGTSGELGLKGTDTGGLGLKGIGDAPVDSSVVDLRHLDPNKPINVNQDALKSQGKKGRQEKVWTTAECEKATATRQRMAEGLPVQLNAIRRTEAQVSAARKDIADVTDEAKTMARDKVKDEIKGYAQDLLTSTQALRAQVEALQAVGANKKTRDNLLKTLHTIVSSGEDLQKAAQAGYSAGADFQKKVDSLTGYIVRANKLFVDSGIAEQLGESLAERTGGPLGAFAFKGATLSIDIGVLAARGKLSKDEYVRARKNLDIMRNQYQRSQKRISELDGGIAKYCTGAPRAAK